MMFIHPSTHEIPDSPAVGAGAGGDELDRADLVAPRIGRLTAAEPDLGLGSGEQRLAPPLTVSGARGRGSDDLRPEQLGRE